MKGTFKICLLVLLGVFSSSFTMDSGSTSPKPVYEKPYMIVGQMPRFPGGKAAMQRYISEKMVYPFEAMKNNVQGKVNVQFVVDKDGSIVDVKAVGQKLGYGLEESAVKLFTDMPKWVPGRQDGIAVPVYMMIPILFSI
ncbi:MAG: energy transducer TonB [Flavobacteriales bacterium]|nr:energy transducer TonB [Flavobacteriales bacterium]